MKKKKFNQKEQKSLEAIREMVNSTPIQPICKGTFRQEFHLLGDIGDVESAFERFIEAGDDERNWSDEFKKEHKEILKQKLLTVTEKMWKEIDERIEAMEKIKAVKKDIERDLETIREKNGKIETTL